MGGGDNTAAMEEVSQTDTGYVVTINIRCSNGSKFSVQINLDSSVDSFKTVLARNCDIPADQQRLIYKGRILKEDQTLRSYGLEADHTVHLVRGSPVPPAPAPAPTTNAAGSISSGASNTVQTNTSAVGSDETGALGAGGAGLGASLLPGLGLGGLGGSAGLFGAGLPDFEQVQQQLTRNPNVMREIMNMPAVQNIMNNPGIMRNLIMNNPQMREIIDRNPELAHILNDPSTLRQTLEAARNPELMREMMRNTDRAMSNIESSPEGFNMLRRMYETVQEPFLNATTMAGNSGNDSSNPFAALLGTQGGNQARDGSTNQSIPTSGTTTNSPAPNTNPLPNPWSSAATGGGQTNTTRSNPSADARPQVPAGIGGLGLPEFEGMFGAMQDSNLPNQLMQNPAISQMMQSLLSTPQYMNQVLGLNPQLQSMLDSNSQLREMVQNPEFLRQLTSPETMQQLLTLQQSLLSQLSQPQSIQEPALTGGAAGTLNNMGLEALMTMFGGLGTGSLAAPNRSDVPPEQLYATQLSQLQEMGFIDTQENIGALIATAGNVHAAVERLLGDSGLAGKSEAFRFLSNQAMTNPTESAEEKPSSSDQQPQEKNSPLNAPVIQERTGQNESNMTDQSEKSDEGDNNVKSHGGDQEKTEGIGGGNLENEKGQESGATGGGSSASISGRKRGRKGDTVHVGSSSGSNSKARKKVELEVVPSCAPTCYVCKRTFWSWKAVFGHLRTHRRQTPGAFPPPTFTPEGSTEKNNEGDKPLKEQFPPTLLNLTRETMQKMSQDSHTTVSPGAASSSSRRGLDIDLNEPITRVLLDLDEPPPP